MVAAPIVTGAVANVFSRRTRTNPPVMVGRAIIRTVWLDTTVVALANPCGEKPHAATHCAFLACAFWPIPTPIASARTSTTATRTEGSSGNALDPGGAVVRVAVVCQPSGRGALRRQSFKAGRTARTNATGIEQMPAREPGSMHVEDGEAAFAHDEDSLAARIHRGARDPGVDTGDGNRRQLSKGAAHVEDGVGTDRSRSCPRSQSRRRSRKCRCAVSMLGSAY